MAPAAPEPAAQVGCSPARSVLQAERILLRSAAVVQVHHRMVALRYLVQLQLRVVAVGPSRKEVTSTPAPPVVQVVAAPAAALVAVAQAVKVPPAGLPAAATRAQVAEVAARVVPAVPASMLMLVLRVRVAPAMRQVARVDLATVRHRARPARRTRETEAAAVAAMRAVAAHLAGQAVPVSSSSVIRQER